MATIVGGLGTSHVPAIANAITGKKHQDPYWKPFFDGYPPVHDWLADLEVDVAVVFYNDHGLNFFLDAMPTFAIGAAPNYQSEDEGWGIGTVEPFDGDTKMSWHLIESLVAADFDVVTCQKLAADHGFWIPLELFWPKRPDGLRVIPVVVNTVQHPMPSAARCWALGKAVGEALRSYEGDERVVVIGSGGLSHQLEGERAGFLNPEFDAWSLDQLCGEPAELAALSIPEIIERAGSQGVEIVSWLAMRGAMGGPVTEVHRNYHIPISNTAAGVLALAPS